MTKMKTLLSAVVILCLASPAIAGGLVRPWYGAWYGAPPQAWACGAYEYAKRYNAEWSTRTHRCGCIVR